MILNSTPASRLSAVLMSWNFNAPHSSTITPFLLFLYPKKSLKCVTTGVVTLVLYISRFECAQVFKAAHGSADGLNLWNILRPYLPLV